MASRKVNLMPLAGSGLRYKKKGYKILKPLIDISGKPMFVRAAEALPKADLYIFVCLKDHIEKYSIDKIIKNYFPKSKIISLTKKTKGQADTCLKAIGFLKDNDSLTIGSCDYSMQYNKITLNKKMKNSDLVVWTFKDKEVVKKNPNMYGYIKINSRGNVIKVACKKKLSSQPWKDQTIIGTFSFKKAKTFVEFTKKLISRSETVNNEFYLDSVVKLCVGAKLNVKANLVNKYFGWGTPSDLEKYFGKK